VFSAALRDGRGGSLEQYDTPPKEGPAHERRKSIDMVGAVQAESSFPRVRKRRLLSTLLLIEPIQWQNGFKVCFQIQLVPLQHEGAAPHAGSGDQAEEPAQR
jgi:hypothetical protein